MIRITVDQIMEWGACYSRLSVETLWADRDALSLRDIAVLDIPRHDVWWPFIHVASEAQRHHLACWCALQVLPVNAPPIVRQYLETEDESIRAAAFGAACNAAGCGAAWFAASDMATHAVWWDAAVRAASSDATTWTRQIEYAITYLEGDEK